MVTIDIRYPMSSVRRGACIRCAWTLAHLPRVTRELRQRSRRARANTRRLSQAELACRLLLLVIMLLSKVLKRDVVTIRPDASVLEAARLMRAEHVGNVIVTDAARRPIGVLTDRDIVVSVIAKDVEHLSMLAVKDVLTPDPIVGLEDEDAEVVLSRMRRGGVRRVPVVDRAGALVGVFALDDVLELLANDLRGVIALVASQHRREESKRP